MRASLSTYGLRGDIEPIVRPALQLGILGAEELVCAPPDCAEVLAGAGVPLVLIGLSP